jgi:putative transposase
MLLREGVSVGCRRIRRLIRKLGRSAIRPQRDTSKPHPEHKIYPYLLRDKTLDQPNQVWAADITYIPMRRGFLYLVAIVDWATRRILSWCLSNTLTAGFCVEALGEALARFTRPGIFNTDQDSQFTSEGFTRVLLNHRFRDQHGSRAKRGCAVQSAATPGSRSGWRRVISSKIAAARRPGE